MKINEIGYIEIESADLRNALRVQDIGEGFYACQSLKGKDRQYFLDEKGRTILLFEFDEHGTLEKLYVPHTPKTLAPHLAKLADMRPDRHAFLKDFLNLPDIAEEDMPEIERRRTYYEAEDAKREALKELGYRDISEKPPHFSLEEIKECFYGARFWSSGEGEYDYILDETGKTILLICKDDEGVPEKIYAPRNRAELTQLIVPVLEQDKAAHHYLSEIFDLPEPTDADYKAARAARKRHDQEEELLAWAEGGASVQYAQSASVAEDRCYGILQGEFAISNARAEKNVIGSFGADTCFLIFIRMPEAIDNQGNLQPASASVAHFDALTNAQSLLPMMAETVGDHGSFEDVEVTIISGSKDRKTLLNILSVFKALNINVSLDVGKGVRHAVMDIESGQIMKHIPHDCGKQKEQRMRIAGLKTQHTGLRMQFDGRSKPALQESAEEAEKKSFPSRPQKKNKALTAL